ncbi:carcinoembryonic antigen-related cell adhesion molecule 21-like [Emys orbicularis]|uniref:carcinoembryonic antigen-related cell adhesion molecule 21-like n=1 Tax=Emys orbicularis TaxID=82168 RepID=UPI0031FD9C1A
MGQPPNRPGGPWRAILLAASVLGSCLQPAPAQTPVTITPPSPMVGGGVSLAPQPTPQNFTSCSWHRSATAAENNRILTYFPQTLPVLYGGRAHTGRETVGPGCVLHIAGLTLGNTGNYTVQIHNPIAASPVLTTVVLRVYEMLPRPSVTPNQTLVLENGAFTLTCNGSPSADTVLWLRDGSYLAPSERLGLSPDNRTLTVLGVTRGDAGAYQCEVGNPVSTNRSEPSTVTVACSGRQSKTPRRSEMTPPRVREPAPCSPGRPSGQTLQPPPSLAVPLPRLPAAFPFLRMGTERPPGSQPRAHRGVASGTNPAALQDRPEPS